MRVLAVHRYYWPDTPPYASLLRAVVGEWHRHGHDLEVLSSQPSYKPGAGNGRRPRREVVDGVRVRRLALRPDSASTTRRLFNTLVFPLLVAARVLAGRRTDLVMCSTMPPVLLGAAVSWAARVRGALFVYHCMDLHPEIGALSGEFARPLVRRLLLRIETATCRRAWRVVVLSEDMRRSVLERDPRLDARIVVLNNFELPAYPDEPDEPGEPEVPDSPLPRDPDRVRVVFTGNLGRFQNLETITRAVLGDDPALAPLELVLMGSGAARAQLAQLVAAAPVERRSRVVLLPHGSPAQARALLRTADYGLVSLAPQVIRYAYPSKTATYLSEGLPLLVAVEPDSELAAMVASSGAGRCLTMDATLGTALAALAEAGPVDASARRAAHEVWSREFSAAVLLPRWVELAEQAAGGGARDHA